jgi:hypothetical protein
MHNFSMDELLQFLYNETPPDMTVRIKQALDEDPSLREKLETLAMAKKRLDALENISPRQEVIDNILLYSRSSTPGK